MAAKAKGVSAGKRGAQVKGMGGGKPTFTMYTGNIVQFGKTVSTKGKMPKKAK